MYDVEKRVGAETSKRFGERYIQKFGERRRGLWKEAKSCGMGERYRVSE